jgi:hypothetical protein
VPRDWVGWHRAYDDPASQLSQRLVAVTAVVRAALDRAAPGPIRVVSLCAGEARDLADAAAGHPRAVDLVGCVVELDPTLADRARQRLAGLAVHVRNADAANPASFADQLPADLLLLVGIFGNVVDDDIAQTVRAVPALTRPGATVVWTRHRQAPDVTPRIRAWFDEIGCEQLSFDSAGPAGFAVGAERVLVAAATPLPVPLFTFRDELGGTREPAPG